MAKTITLTYNNKEYTLEFNRAVIKQLENRGFDPTDNRTANNIEFLVAGAFVKNHKGIKSSVINEIFELIPDKEGFITKLIEMYNEPLADLMSEPTGDDVGKVSWTAN